MQILSPKEEIFRRVATLLKTDERVVVWVYDQMMEHLLAYIKNPHMAQFKLPYFGRFEVSHEDLRAKAFVALRRIRKAKEENQQINRRKYTEIFRYLYSLLKVLGPLLDKRHRAKRLRRQVYRQRKILLDFDKRNVYFGKTVTNTTPPGATYELDRIVKESLPRHGNNYFFKMHERRKYIEEQRKKNLPIDPEKVKPIPPSDVYTRYFERLAAAQPKGIQWSLDNIEVKKRTEEDRAFQEAAMEKRLAGKNFYLTERKKRIKYGKY